MVIHNIEDMNNFIAERGVSLDDMLVYYKFFSKTISYKSYVIHRDYLIDRDDVESKLKIAMIRAISSWDTAKSSKCKFTTYVYTALDFARRQLLMDVYKHIKVSLASDTTVVINKSDCTSSSDDTEKVPFDLDVLSGGTTSETTYNFAIKDFFRNLYRCAETHTEKAIVVNLRRYYTKERDINKFIAKKLNMNPVNVCRILKGIGRRSALRNGVKEIF